MADLQEQLQAVLGDPEAMSQIAAIARALTGSPAAPESPPPPKEPEIREAEFVPVDTPAPQASGGQAPDLSALLGSLGGEAGGNIDPKLVRIALRVFSEYSSQDDEKVALLASLKPFLRNERLEKMEKAEKIARLSRVVRAALQLLKEDGDSHV